MPLPVEEVKRRLEEGWRPRVKVVKSKGYTYKCLYLRKWDPNSNRRVEIYAGKLTSELKALLEVYPHKVKSLPPHKGGVGVNSYLENVTLCDTSGVTFTSSMGSPVSEKILYLLESTGEEYNAKYIALRLGVSYSSVRKALERLVRRGLIVRSKRGFYKAVKTVKPGVYPHNVTEGGLGGSAGFPTGLDVGVVPVGVHGLELYFPRGVSGFWRELVFEPLEGVGVRVVVSGSSVDVRVRVGRDRGLNVFEYMFVLGYIDRVLEPFGLNVYDFVVRQVGFDFGVERRVFTNLNFVVKEFNERLLVQLYGHGGVPRLDVHVKNTSMSPEEVKAALEHVALILSGGVSQSQLLQSTYVALRFVPELKGFLEELGRQNRSIIELLSRLISRLDVFPRSSSRGGMHG